MGAATAPRQKTVLITGASAGGIGAALALEFHRRGLRVLATARDLSRMSDLAALGIETLALDVTSDVSARDCAAEVAKRTSGRLDLLVNNAGIGLQAALLDSGTDAARHVFDVNVLGVLSVTKAFAPLVVRARGRIVNVGSVVACVPVPWQGIYNASKAALRSLSDGMRVEMRPLGVTVIHVVTGGVKTNFFANTGGYNFPEESLYAPARERLESAIRGDVSKGVADTTPEAYAKAVVGNALSRWPSKEQWTGSTSTLIWLGTFLWHTASDPVLAVMYKLWGASSILARAEREKQAAADSEVESPSRE